MRADDPDAWSRLDRPTVRHFEPVPELGLALLLDDDGLSAYDADGLAWVSDHLGPEAVWLGRLDDEVHLRAGERLHRVQLRSRHHRHGGVLLVTELARMRWWHVAELLPVERELFAPEPWSERLFWSELGQLDTRHYVVALEDGRVVGYAGLCDYPDEAFVQTMAVAPSAQGRGLGARLLVELLEEAARRGQRTVSLEVRADNAPGPAALRAARLHPHRRPPRLLRRRRRRPGARRAGGERAAVRDVLRRARWGGRNAGRTTVAPGRPAACAVGWPERRTQRRRGTSCVVRREVPERMTQGRRRRRSAHHLSVGWSA